MAKPDWLSISKTPSKKKISTRTIITKHLKEWNRDKVDKRFLEDIRESLEDERGRKVTTEEAEEVLGPEDFKENRRAKEDADFNFKHGFGRG